MSQSKMGRKELLKAIKQLEKNPNDRVKILGEIGIFGVGAIAGGAGAALAGTTIASIPLITALTGFGVVVAAPAALVAGSVVAGGTAAYGIAKLVGNGVMHDIKRKELKKRLEERLREIECDEHQTNLTVEEKNSFIIFLKEPLQQNLITSEQAQELIEGIESGQIPLEEAYNLLYEIISDKKKSLPS